VLVRARLDRAYDRASPKRAVIARTARFAPSSPAAANQGFSCSSNIHLASPGGDHRGPIEDAGEARATDLGRFHPALHQVDDLPK
jgi:hypothetical protein